jgi:hypothetical protein
MHSNKSIHLSREHKILDVYVSIKKTSKIWVTKMIKSQGEKLIHNYN